MIPADLADAVGSALGSRVTTGTALRGGDVAEAYAVDLADGRRVFAKTHRSPPPHFFGTEAAGLAWLRAADALPVPEVLAVSDADPAFLVLEWVDVGGGPGGRSGSGEAEFGRGLAALHAAGAPSFGRADARTTGSLALPNDPCDTWSEFYAERRLRPLARRATDRGALAPGSIAALERIADRLGEFGGPRRPPARLHGDLWAGNRVIDHTGRSWLIDPAAHGGHHEFDLAMMRLFGGFGDACFTAYDEAAPLDDGWQDRIALHQLAPLVVHAIKFGGGYVNAVDDALARYR
ncbi:MAG: fructosamine kinase family protein [Acidimicrobiales bacterium]